MKNSNPVRLSKSNTMQENMESWLDRHAPLLLFICIIILFFLIVAVIVAWFNVAAAPTATEANLWYNNLERII